MDLFLIKWNLMSADSTITAQSVTKVKESTSTVSLRPLQKNRQTQTNTASASGSVTTSWLMTISKSRQNSGFLEATLRIIRLPNLNLPTPWWLLAQMTRDSSSYVKISMFSFSLRYLTNWSKSTLFWIIKQAGQCISHAVWKPITSTREKT